MVRYHIFARVVRAAGPIVAETRPGRDQDGGAELRAGREDQWLDLGMWVQEVR